MAKKPPPPIGGTLADYLDELGEREEVYGAAAKRVLSAQFEAALEARPLSKRQMAVKLKTSRSQITRVLDPTHVSVSLDMLDKVARVLGKRLKIELVDA
jgi:hypothetical protein